MGSRKKKDEGIQQPLAALGKLAKGMKKAAGPAPRGRLKGPSAPQAPAPKVPVVVPETRPNAMETALTTEKTPNAKAFADDLAGYSNDDRVAFHQAFAGVESLDSPHHRKRGPDRKNLAKAVRARAEEAEEDARSRLDSLVGGGVFFDVARAADGTVEGKRRGTPDRTCRMLAEGRLAPVARLDLHGFRKDEVSRRVRAFVRDSHGKGRLDLALIHGKGLHSEGGKGVLQSAVVEALTRGGAAPLVEAFATAPRRFGGDGVLLVRLRARLR